jgi:uncharacterized protein (TIGR02145 family)
MKHIIICILTMNILFSCSLDKKVNSTVIDIDGNQYKTVFIGKQEWMAENLDVTKFQNGDIIIETKTKAEWESAIQNKQPAWCFYNYSKKNGEKYGKLYNWYAVIDSRGLAPEGWQIPNYQDWEQLIKFLNHDDLNIDIGIKMKSKNGWNDNGNGTNESGFNGLPGGGIDCEGEFKNIGELGCWWLPKKENMRINMVLCFVNGELGLTGDENFDCGKYETGDGSNAGMSIRCIKSN